MMAAVVGAIGAAVRVAFYLQRRSLWQDECFLSLNVLTRSLGELVGRSLGFEQLAPPLFLALEWVASRVGGAGELSLRAPSLVAGLAVLVAMWWLARQFLPEPAALLAMTLAALSPHLVRYSSEVKPYTFDALGTLVIVGLALRLSRDPMSRRLWGLFVVAGLGVVGFSTGAPFVLGGAWLALLALPAVRAAPTARRGLTVAAVLWGGTWLAIYLAVYRGVAGSLAMQTFWQAAFMPINLRDAAVLHRRWTVEVMAGQAHLGIPRAAGLILFLLTALGLVWQWRKSKASGTLLLAGPVGLLYLASLLRLYPIGSRLMSFAVPLLFILVASGVTAIFEAFRHPVYRGTVGLGALLLVVPGGLGLYQGGAAVAILEEVRPLLADSVFVGNPAEPIYVFGKAMPAWIYYTTEWSSADTARTARLMELARRIGPNSGNAPSRGHPVNHEGWDLVVADQRRQLLVGVPSGYQAVLRTEWSPPPLDPGWGRNEALRFMAELRSEGASCGWLLFSHHKPNEMDQIGRALVLEGATLAHRNQTISADLRRYCRPS